MMIILKKIFKTHELQQYDVTLEMHRCNGKHLNIPTIHTCAERMFDFDVSGHKCHRFFIDTFKKAQLSSDWVVAF